MNDQIWCHVRLPQVANVIDEYQPWKVDPWYTEVDWKKVTDAVIELLQRIARCGVVDDVTSRVDELQPKLGTRDSEGARSLLLEPITVTRLQLTNGGHRLKAMRSQGVAAAPGLFSRDDVGHSIHPADVYPACT